MQYPQRNISFFLHHAGRYVLRCAIYGRTDEAVIETATFLWSLPYTGDGHNCLEIRHAGLFDLNRFAAFRPEQLTRILDANTKRIYEIQAGCWTPEQSLVFATRPYPLYLKIHYSPNKRGNFFFQDDGTAFVEALEQRESSFGTLALVFSKKEEVPFSNENLKRLLTLENIIDTIFVCTVNDECALLPFSAKVKDLEYAFEANSMQLSDFESLQIVATTFTCTMFVDGVDLWERYLLALLERVADLGHFESLYLSIDYSDQSEMAQLKEYDVPAIAEVLIRIIRSNPKLTTFNMSEIQWRLDWATHLPHIFKAMEDHKGLRTVILKSYPREDPSFSWLKQLLFRNNNITVLDGSRTRISP
jgi:hypothetical protein